MSKKRKEHYRRDKYQRSRRPSWGKVKRALIERGEFHDRGTNIIIRVIQ